VVWHDQFWHARILAEHAHERADVAALQLVEPPRPLPYLDLDSHRRQRRGDQIASFGYPQGDWWQREGIPIDGALGAVFMST
jgi:hypothetical protein